MPAARPWLFALLPLFAACQSLHQAPPQASPAGQVRLQGEIGRQGGQAFLRPCQESRRFLLADAGHAELTQAIDDQLASGSGPLFADLKGALGSGGNDNDGQLQVSDIYRLQRTARACEDPNFKRLTLRAVGSQWAVNVGSQGLELDRNGQPPLALPYVEEGLPNGALDLSSEANGQRVELWVAPQRCLDAASGALMHLTAELRVDGAVQRGCAYYGGGRD